MKTDELRLELLASVAAVGLVRTLVEQRLLKWGLAGLVTDTTLVAAELVTNAVEAAPTGSVVQVRLSREPNGVLLEVWDPVDALPQARQPRLDLADDPARDDPARVAHPYFDRPADRTRSGGADFDDNGGWGLTIVEALSVEAGYERTRGGGKTVWARLKSL
ncbi:ATP-binding protein [Spirillospora sp. NPDC047279]|uniref:ATP-binding protein n=1 Tax=Spirillospora sp. NPDC047279 TaxID=3155478 RepID=UPI00340C584A